MNNKTTGLFVAFFLSVIISILCIFMGFPEGSEYTHEYILLGCLMIAYLIINFLFFIRFSLYIFEPITLVFVLYLFVFFIDPMINICTSETVCMGHDVMGGCESATLIFFFSYICFLFGYYGTFRKNMGINTVDIYEIEGENIEEDNWAHSNIEIAALVIWIISFAFGCIELVSKGMSLSYFLTLGLQGEIENLYADSAFGFLGNFRFSMITAWVYLFVCNRKSLSTKICGLLTLEYFILRGFRHSLFVVIFAPIVYSFIKDKRTPKFRSLVIMLTVVVLVMGGMQFVRGSLREGTSVDWSTFDTSIFVDAIQGNCDVYKTFYGMVEVVPSELSYQLGKASIVSVITMIVPRRIWPSKPISPIITNLYMFCGNQAAKSGYAMPNISEYYLDFGSVGCCVCLFIFGKILQKLKENYELRPYDKHGLILYAIFFPALLQVVLRGYSPSYVYLLFFYAFPVIVMKSVVRSS